MVGLPHNRLGEQVAAILILRDGYAWESSNTGASALRDFALVPFCKQSGAGLLFLCLELLLVSGWLLQRVVTKGHMCQRVAAGGEGVLTAAQMVQFCRDLGLAGFKLPRVLHAQKSSLPVNASGKVLKHVVKEKLLRLEEAVFRSRM